MATRPTSAGDFRNLTRPGDQVNALEVKPLWNPVSACFGAADVRCDPSTRVARSRTRSIIHSTLRAIRSTGIAAAMRDRTASVSLSFPYLMPPGSLF